MTTTEKINHKISQIIISNQDNRATHSKIRGELLKIRQYLLFFNFPDYVCLIIREI